MGVKHIGDDCYYTSPFCAEKVFGMYLGDNDSIETIISSKTLTSLTGVKEYILILNLSILDLN